VEQALELFLTMPRMGVKPDTSTYAILIEAFGASGRTQEVLDLVRDMKHKNVCPNLAVQRAIVASLTGSKDLEAQVVLSDTKTQGLPPTHGLWAVYFTHNQPDNLLKVLKQMVEEEVPEPTLFLRTLYYFMERKDHIRIPALVKIVTSSKVMFGKDFAALKIVRALESNGYYRLASAVEQWAQKVGDFRESVVNNM